MLSITNSLQVTQFTVYLHNENFIVLQWTPLLTKYSDIDAVFITIIIDIKHTFVFYLFDKNTLWNRFTVRLPFSISFQWHRASIKEKYTLTSG